MEYHFSPSNGLVSFLSTVIVLYGVQRIPSQHFHNGTGSGKGIAEDGWLLEGVFGVSCFVGLCFLKWLFFHFAFIGCKVFHLVSLGVAGVSTYLYVVLISLMLVALRDSCWSEVVGWFLL
ncbi:hypothetical protein L1049_015078 [Liquidambar formosana]|uniref:Transmembrane protein n=1 Tax=Liquidambar formosana TaxID=63359 RepID=A0AAP0RXI1_LIQFO